MPFLPIPRFTLSVSTKRSYVSLIARSWIEGRSCLMAFGTRISLTVARPNITVAARFNP
jgi:hypothetical protein